MHAGVVIGIVAVVSKPTQNCGKKDGQLYSYV